MTPRAAMDAARAVFESVTGRPQHGTTGTPEFIELDAALATPRGRAQALWHHSEAILQAVVARPELTGQALVAEARRVHRLSLGDAHALIALQGWVDRVQDRTQEDPSQAAPTSEEERAVAREAWRALENAVDQPPEVTPASVSASAPSPMVGAAQATPTAASATERDDARDSLTPPPPSARPWYRSSAAVIGAVILLLLGGGAGFALYQYQSQRDFRDGLGAYERGARDVARVAFARAAQAHPDDARPLVFLGRMAREENDFARARRFHEQAVTLDPRSAAAQRELASTLLAEGHSELARRFYVRAVEIDPTDKLAQGFLGCALFRLGRYDEARRWADRAGPGDWMPCLNAPPPVPMTPIPPR